ncbi:MAG: sodium-translocating pyrophosphatase [Candidatus Asgardarchaeia archaeon]
MLWSMFSFLTSLAAIFTALFIAYYIKKQEEPSGKIAEIASAIQEGARAFLKVQDKYLLIIVIPMSIALFIFLGPYVSLAYIAGSVSSMVAGILGMEVAVRANARTAYFASKEGEKKAFMISYLGGSVMGLSVVGFALAGVTLFYLLFRDFTVVLGFSLGASSVALFAKAGGGIYTKTADIAADLVGKVELNLPEDDPRNPAVIADNVGDNVGDVAGMASDLYDSYVASIVAAMVIGAEQYLMGNMSELYVYLPVMIASGGIIATLMGLSLIKIRMRENPGATLNMITISAIAFYVVILLALVYIIGVNWGVFYSTVSGLIAGGVMGIATDYYTSIDRKPVQKIAEASETGTAVNILVGFSYGLISIVPGIIGVAAAIVFSWYISSYFGLYEIYGIAISAVGMLGIVGTIVSADAYGPIGDNAKGIAEQSGLEEDVIAILDRLDASGNTSKAITKGFAIGAAALTVLALFAAYAEIVDINILVNKGTVLVDPSKVLNLINPNIVAGLFIGSMLPPVLSAMLILSVSKNTEVMINEVRRQIKEMPGILDGSQKPDYARCVHIAEKGALKELIPAGLVATLSPIAVGILLGVRALAGFLAGSIMTGFIFALFMANSGGAWDNAKKFIEEGHFGGKGSEAHKAAVSGDTVGDPFKDTAGPSLNTMITVMSLVASTFAPVILMFALFP